MKKARRPKKSADVDYTATDVVDALQMMHDACAAEVARLEAEEAEKRKNIDTLLDAELAAKRKDAFYYHMARLMIAGIDPEIVGQWLRTPEHLQKALNVFKKLKKIGEENVDQFGLRIVKCYRAAVQKHGRENLKDCRYIQDEHREMYPTLSVPQGWMIARKLNTLELHRFNLKRGHPVGR